MGDLFAAQISRKAGLHDLWRVLIDIRGHKQNRLSATASWSHKRATFLLEVAQSIVVAFPRFPNVALNLKTQLGRASPLSRHARIPFRGTLA